MVLEAEIARDIAPTTDPSRDDRPDHGDGREQSLVGRGADPR